MSDLTELRARLAEVARAGRCAHPIRLAGQSLDPATGEWWEGAIGISCKDRRSAICPACARRYQDDAWHLVAAGLRGGKGVPELVAGHPMLFATLTAPSFGPVHALRPRGPCRPRRAVPVCAHGVGLSCSETHDPTSTILGEPLCAECFDYEGAVLWNAQVRPLWRATTRLLHRAIAKEGGVTVRQADAAIRCAHVKVAEFQRRGLVHLHVVLRADGRDGPASAPPAWLDVTLFERTLRAAAARARVPSLEEGKEICWGRELDVAAIGGEDPSGADVVAVARYLAKYAVKSSEESGALARRLTSLSQLAALAPRAHVARLVETAWELGGRRELEVLRLRAHAHTFGYRGHFATKSQRYSTTFGALRGARAAFRQPDGPKERSLRYAGRGYRTASTANLAAVLEAARRDLPRSPAHPHAVPDDIPTAAHQGKRP